MQHGSRAVSSMPWSTDLHSIIADYLAGRVRIRPLLTRSVESLLLGTVADLSMVAATKGAPPTRSSAGFLLDRVSCIACDRRLNVLFVVTDTSVLRLELASFATP